MSHKPMSGGQYRETSQHDTVGELSKASVEGTKDRIDKGAAKFWAKRGMMDPSKSKIVYGKKYNG